MIFSLEINVGRGILRSSVFFSGLNNQPTQVTYPVPRFGFSEQQRESISGPRLPDAAELFSLLQKQDAILALLLAELDVCKTEIVSLQSLKQNRQEPSTEVRRDKSMVDSHSSLKQREEVSCYVFLQSCCFFNKICCSWYRLSFQSETEQCSQCSKGVAG